MDSRCAGASVLPYTWSPSGKLYLLLAQDADGGKWSDFGGGLLSRYESEVTCAKRELKEESHGLIRVPDLGAVPKFRFQFYDRKGRLRHYTTYLAEVPYSVNIHHAFGKERTKLRCMNLPPKIRNARLEKLQVDYLLPGEPKGGLRAFFNLRLRFLTPFIDQVRRAIETGTRIPFTSLVKTFDIRTP